MTLRAPLNLAQVAGHGLLEGEQPDALGLDLAVHLVHQIILDQNTLGQRDIVLLDGLDGVPEHGARQSAHVQEFLL